MGGGCGTYWGVGCGVWDGGEDEGEVWGAKGGKSGSGKLLGGGALLNAGPAHLTEGGDGPFSLGGEGPFCLGGEPLSNEVAGISARFS